MDWEPSSYTYADLRREHVSRLEEEHKSLQQIRNHTSTLQLFMRAIGRHDGDEYSEDFSIRFDERLAQFHSWSIEHGVSIATIANRISYLRAFKDTSASTSCNVKGQDGFCSALKAFIMQKEVTPLILSKYTGVSIKKIRGWMNGILPTMKSIDDIGRIEKYFCIKDGTLKNKLRAVHAVLKDGEEEHPVIRWRNSHLMMDTYCYTVASPKITQEWRELVKMYTAPYLLGGFQRNTTWRTKPDTNILRKRTWAGEAQNGYCVTAEMRWRHYSSFFGYFLRDITLGGRGFKEEDLSLALATDVNNVAGYIEFRFGRSGVYTQETEQCLAFFMSLIRKQTGYLWQKPQFGQSLSTPIAKEDWHEWCETNHQAMKDMLRGLRSGGHIKKGRDPSLPIQQILASGNPIHIILKMIDRMESQLVLDYSNHYVALRHRNILLIKMMLSNPLRVYNYSLMSYRKDNTGNLYQGDNNEWRLRFSPEDFKNQRGAAKKGYDVLLSEWLYDDIEEYIDTYRPYLCSAECSDHLFLPGRVGGRGKISRPYWEPSKISNTIVHLTRRFIPNCPGFGAHAFRHIVATDFIKNNPNGFQVAASILHDKLETVMKEYAHIKVADGFSHWTNYFEAQVKGAKHE